MPKITTQDKIEAVEIIRKLIKNYGVQYTSNVSDGVLAELDNRVKKLERELSTLLAPPAPKKPKQPRKQDSKAQAEAVSSEPIARYEPSGTVVPVPDGLQFKENAILKRSRGK